MSRSEVQAFVQAQSLSRAEQSTAPDRLQPTLLRRCGFRRQVSASVRQLKGKKVHSSAEVKEVRDHGKFSLAVLFC